MKSLVFIVSSTLLLLSSKVSSSDEELIKQAPEPLLAPANPPVYPPKLPVTTSPQIPPAMPPPTQPIIMTKADCIPGCDGRCKLHSRKRVCMRACMTCCDRCKCVPPGTYGNREMCGKCYTDMTTHGNRITCP